MNRLLSLAAVLALCSPLSAVNVPSHTTTGQDRAGLRTMDPLYFFSLHPTTVVVTNEGNVYEHPFLLIFARSTPPEDQPELVRAAMTRSYLVIAEEMEEGEVPILVFHRVRMADGKVGELVP